MIQGDSKDKELNMQVNTRLSKTSRGTACKYLEHFCFARKIKNTNQTSLGLQVRLREDLLNPPLEEQPSVFPP